MQRGWVRSRLRATIVRNRRGVPIAVSANYNKIEADPETGFPRGIGLDTISGLTMLMQDNKNRLVFAKKPGG